MLSHQNEVQVLTEKLNEDTTVNTTASVGPFAGTIPGMVDGPIIPGSITIGPVGEEQFTDANGDGVLVGGSGGTGTINYQTGAFSITLNSASAGGIDILASYQRAKDADAVNIKSVGVFPNTARLVASKDAGDVGYIIYGKDGANGTKRLVKQGVLKANGAVVVGNFGYEFMDVRVNKPHTRFEATGLNPT